MYLLIKEIYDIVEKYDEIYVYGAGEIGQKFYQLCCDFQVADKVKGFIVTHKSKESKDLMGIPIMEVRQCLMFNSRQLIFVAVNDNNEKEIRRIFACFPNLQVTYISQYMRGVYKKGIDDDLIYEQLKGKSFYALCRYITEWYMSEHCDEIKQFNENVLRLSNYERKNDRTSQRNITFIIGRLNARIFRIAKELRGNGFDIDVIRWDKYSDMFVSKGEFDREQICVKNCKNVEEILYHALQGDKRIFFIDSPYFSACVAELMLEHKEYFGKIIFSPYDLLHGCYILEHERWYYSERSALEHSDGVVWRYFAKEYVEDLFSIKISGKSIQFYDFCDEFEPKPKKQDDVLKICGICSHAYDLFDINETKYIKNTPIHIILEQLGNRDDCVIHYYLWVATDQEKEKFNYLETKYKNFKVFYHLEHDLLIQRISQYDYGCDLYTNNKPPVWPDSYGIHTWGTFAYAMCNKYFDFLTAEIPIITTQPFVLCDILKKENVLVEMNGDKLDIEYLKKHKKYYAEMAKATHKKFKISRHIDKMIEFIDSLFWDEEGEVV